MPKFEVTTLGVAVALAAVVALACAPQQGTPGATAPALTPTPTTLPLPSGQELYVSKGCAACHGQDAEGSPIAPALPGHTQEQVKRQVRSPIGAMPRFGQEQVSNEELAEIAEYIESLALAEVHIEPTELPLKQVVVMHHWMALMALKVNNVSEAEHHVRHIIQLVEDQEHRAGMGEVLELLGAGDLHQAQHEIEEMLAGRAEPELGIAELHLQLALSAISADEPSDARHHLEHFVGPAIGQNEEKAQAALDLLAEGRLHDAEATIVEMIEGMPHRHHQHN